MASSVPGAGWASKAVFQLGRGKTLAVPMTVHETARQKLVQAFAKAGVSNGIVLLQGGEETCMYDTDTDVLFRQDSWFNYLFGVMEASMFGAISLSTGEATLFIPRLGETYSIWCGEVKSPSMFKESYAMNHVLYTEELSEWLRSTLQKEGSGAKLHLMKGVNSDSGSEAKPARFEGIEEFSGVTDLSQLYNLLSYGRVIKSKAEIELMRYVAHVASQAHSELMRHAKDASFEYELEAKFQYEIYRNGGCRRTAYVCIGACGPNSAVLHYGHAGAPNDRVLQQTDMALLDMGAEYHGYVSDITCSFPISGKFSEDQRLVYEAVLNAQRAVLRIMLPGTPWPACHLAAEREILLALQRGGLLSADASIEELIAARLGGVFFPHGLGHLIGCDTHDVGGYLPGTPERSDIPGLVKLRTSRVLEAGMVLTNEPGCYFIDALLDKALANPEQAKFINNAVLQRFRGFGGVRLEDVVVVRTAEEGGPESLSTCPRTVEEIEGIMQRNEVWPPLVDSAPELKRSWHKLAANGHGMVRNLGVTC